MVSFIFGGDTGETPESIKRKRDVVRALLGAQGAPRNIGEGLNALGDGIVANVLDRRADKAEKAGLDSANSAFSSLFADGNSSGQSSAVPMSDAGAEISAGKPIDMTGNQVYGDFIDTVKTGVTNPYGLAAVAATGKAESGYSPENATRTWSDPSESGQPGRAGGIMSWRGPRYEALAASGDLSPKGQAKFFLQENPQLIAALNNAKSVEEAQTLMNNAWQFAGYNRPGGEAARRLGLAQGFLPSFQGASQPTEVASAEPMTASDAIAAQAPQLPSVGPRPMVTGGTGVPTASRGPVQALTAPPQAAPALPPPTTVAPPPPVASVPQQVAQAAPQTPAQALSSGPSMQQLIQASQNKFLSEGQRGVVNALLKQKLDQQEADRQLAIKQRDPAYQADLAKTNLEIENLRNPKISPADQARIDLEKGKIDFERNGISASDKAKNDLDKERLALDREKFDAELKKGQWQKLTDGRLYNETTGEFRDAPPPLPGSTPPKFDDISGVRKEIQQLPSYKNLAQAAPIYKSMAETAGRNTKASDLNLVYGLGKIMDPNSVVREGEMVMVKNTASLPDWLQGAIASLNGGAALTPETRQAIMTEAFGRVTGYSDEFGRNIEQYKGIAQRNNMNPDDIIPPIDKFEPWKASNAPTATNIGVDWQELSPGVRIRKVN